MPRPTKPQLAKLKALTDMGQTPTAAAKVVGIDHHTALSYIRDRAAVFEDREIKAMINRLKQAELDQLTTITGKARLILDQYLDDVMAGEREANPISVTAILDRTFQQRRLVEGASTVNVSLRSVAEQAAQRLAEIEAEIAALDAE